MSEVNSGADQQPDELNALSVVVEEFIKRLSTIDGEIDLLKEDRKELIAEYKGKLDYKTLSAAMKIVKTKRAVEHKHTLDVFLDIIESKDLSA